MYMHVRVSVYIFVFIIVCIYICIHNLKKLLRCRSIAYEKVVFIFVRIKIIHMQYCCSEALQASDTGSSVLFAYATLLPLRTSDTGSFRLYLRTCETLALMY